MASGHPPSAGLSPAGTATSIAALIHLLVTFVKLLRSGGVRAVAAESLLLKHQLLISNRSRQRAPNLTTLARFVLALTALFVSPRRIAKLGVLVKPATLLRFHKALVDHKYRLLFSSSLTVAANRAPKVLQDNSSRRSSR